MLANLRDKITSMSKTNIILLIVFVSLLLGAALYVYHTYVLPRMDPNFIPNKEFIKNDPYEEPAKFTIYYVDWCPHSKSAMKVWEAAKKEYDGVKINNLVVKFIGVDCTNKSEEDIETYKIDGYPTMKLEKDKDGEKEVIEFDAKPTIDNIGDLLNTVM